MIEYAAFRNCKISRLVLPDNLTEIGDEAFQNCKELSGVVFSSNLNSIGGAAFRGCTSLTELILPERLEIIFDNAFEGCTGLSEIVIPNGVTNIFGGAFRDCTGVSTITLGSNVQYIWPNAFLHIPVMHVYLFAVSPPIIFSGSEDTIFSITPSTTLHIPSGTLNDYLDSAWERIGFTNIVEM